MKIIAAVILVFAIGGIARAQDKSNQLSPTVRIYEPKNLAVYRAGQVAQFVQSVMGGTTLQRGTVDNSSVAKVTSGMQIYWDDVPHAIVIRGGTPAEQDAAEVLLKRFDVPESKSDARTERPPASSFEITAFLIRADAEDPQPGMKPIPVLMPVPKDLQSALDEMRQTFTYHDYHLWDAVVTQAGGQVNLSGILPARPNSSPNTYGLSFLRSIVNDDKTITLDGFEFVLKQPWGNEPLQSRIAHNVTLHVGQKLVLGKIRLIPGENADLFLIMTAKIR